MELKIKSILKPKLGILLLVLLITSFSSVKAQSSGVINLGLYGGASMDYSWAYSTNRLFSGVETPASLYFTDDYCATWTQAFPTDSLEYITDSYSRGWGGGATRVLSNLTGWVGVLTHEQGGTLSSAVISFNDGDYGSFETAYDGYRLKHVESSYGYSNTTAIGLSDYFFYIGLESALTRIYDGYTIGSANIVYDLNTLGGTNTNINWIAVANTTSGYPVFMVANVPNDQYGKLYSYDGTTATEITGTGIPPTYGFERIFIHPTETTINTLIASVVLKTGNTRKLYLSSDGGTTWTDITPGGYETAWALEDADYSPDWVASMPISNGLILSYPGVEQSDDLGATWSDHMLPDNATATHPSDLNYVVGSKNDGPKLSSTGEEGTFNDVDNDGHSAVSMTKISHKDTDVYYVASKAGLGYTDAYFDPSVVGIDQWTAPHGDFPISGVGTDSGISSVAVDPSDEDHVIAGGTEGFYTTFTGPTGFTSYQPTDWDSGSQLDYCVTDIKFVSSSIVIAVTGTGSNRLPDPTANYGNVWYSTDGGIHWTKVTLTDIDGAGDVVDFEQGKALVVGFGTSTTVIYAATGYYDATDPLSGGQLWKSEDDGVTWDFINYGPTGAVSGTTRMPIYDIDIHPNADSTDVLYLASGQNTDYGFCRTKDGGLTYNHLLVTAEGSFSSVLVNADSPEIVNVAAKNNLYRYNLILASTTLVYEGLPGEFIPDLETGSTLLATNTGFYKLSEELGDITTTWNGDGDWDEVSKWSNGVPYEICTTIVESGTLEVNMEGKTHAISVSPGAALTVSTSESLTLTGDLTLHSDENGYASFIDDGNISVDGTVIVERYITADQWHYITPPISDGKADIFDDLYLSYYDEPTSTWVEVMAPTEDLFAGQGYKTWAWEGVTGDATLEFSGTLNTGDFSPILTLTGTPEETGWNMIGNNFPSAIDWGTDNNPVSGYALANIDNTIYFWNNDQYATYNPSGDGVATNGGTQYIASMQAFFVHANASSPTVTIPQESRLHHTQDFRKENTNTSALSLTVSSSSHSDEIIIIPNNIATIDFDKKYDAYKLFGRAIAPQFYNIMENEILSVNNLPITDDVIHQPLGFVPGSSENHTIEVRGIENFANGIIITLEDLQEEKIIDLKYESNYTFYAAVNDDPDRFILHIDATASGVEEVSSLDHLIFSSKGNIIILEKQGRILKGHVKVYDLLGKKQFEQELVGDSKQIINLELNSGVYIVEICCDDAIQTQKVYIE